MLLNTKDLLKYTELREIFSQWYGTNPERTAMEIGPLNGDILLPVTVETFARLYKEKILNPETNDEIVVSPDELAFRERLKIVGYVNRADVERALKELDKEEDNDATD